MQYGSKEWSEWVLDEEEAMKHIKYALVHLRIYLMPQYTDTYRLCRYDAGIQTFDTANVVHVHHPFYGH